jgi:hypothetical protein
MGGDVKTDVTIEGIDRAVRDVFAQVTTTGQERTAHQSDHPSTD